MHRISERSVQLVQQKALLAQEHGKSIVACGKSLQRRIQPSQSHGQSIELRGLLIQQYARESLRYAQLLLIQGLNSTELYGHAVQSHVKARKAYSEAVAIYAQVVQGKLKGLRGDTPAHTALWREAPSCYTFSAASPAPIVARRSSPSDLKTCC